MATVYSTQVTALDVTSPAAVLKPSELAGRVRIAYFDYTTPSSGAPAVGDVLRAVKLPKHARVIDFMLVWEALSSGGGTAGADVGLSASGQGARYLAALNMDSAGTQRGTPTIDKLPDGTLLADNPTYFTLTVTGEAWATSKKIQGWVSYVKD
jgi:hypothetical protein